MEPQEYRAWMQLQREVETRKNKSGHRSGLKVKTVEEETIEDQLFEALELSFGSVDPAGTIPTLDRLVRFYARYEPERSIEQCIRFGETWKGKEDQMWKSLIGKYGAEPTGPVTPVAWP